MASGYGVFSSKGPAGDGSWSYSSGDWLYSPSHL